jgi:HK97 family phage major capsid protein
VLFTADEMTDWTSFQKKLFAKIPLAMRRERPEFWMTANTWEANIQTLQDSVGQPVAREIYNPVTGDMTCKFNGRDVILVEEGLGIVNFDDAAADDVFGLYIVPNKGYAINSNMEFHVKRYYDDEKNQWVDKALVINDGKVLDPKYIYLLKKAA